MTSDECQVGGERVETQPAERRQDEPTRRKSTVAQPASTHGRTRATSASEITKASGRPQSEIDAFGDPVLGGQYL